MRTRTKVITGLAVAVVVIGGLGSSQEDEVDTVATEPSTTTSTTLSPAEEMLATTEDCDQLERENARAQSDIEEYYTDAEVAEGLDGPAGDKLRILDITSERYEELGCGE